MTLVNVMTVRESILLCIEYRINGAESQLRSFDNSKPTKLAKNQIIALQKNLECIYLNVEITGGGKRGKVIVSGLKEVVSEKVDKRNDNTAGQPKSNEQTLMNQYIFNQIYEMYMKNLHMEYSITGWSKKVGMLDAKEDIPALRFERRIREVHINTSFYRFKPEEIVRVFQTDTLYNRNKQVMESALKSLKKSGEIDYIQHFNVAGCNGKSRKIEEVEYEEIKAERISLLESLGSNISSYNYAIGNNSPSKEMKIILTKVSNMLEKKFDCDFIYESYEVISVKMQDTYNLTKENFMEAYWTRLLSLTESRQRGYDKQPEEKQTWFWRKFYCYNTLCLLEYMGIDTNGLLLQYEVQNTVRAKELSEAFHVWENKDKPVGFDWSQ